MSLEVKIFNQRDPRWANDQHGTSNSTIGKTGCTISVIASMLCHAGYDVTPKTLNQVLTQNSGYASGNLILWQRVADLFPRVKFIYRHGSYKNDLAVDWLNKGMLPIIEVKGEAIGAPGGKHWVGFVGDQKAIDPWEGALTPTSKWSPTGMALYEYTPQPDGSSTPSDEWGNTVKKSTYHDQTVKYLDPEADPVEYSSEKVINAIKGYKSRATEYETKLANIGSVEVQGLDGNKHPVSYYVAETHNRTEQVSRLGDQLSDKDGVINDLRDQLKQAVDGVKGDAAYQKQIASLELQVESIAKEKGELNHTITTLQTANAGLERALDEAKKSGCGGLSASEHFRMALLKFLNLGGANG